jgi:DeoR/GlpR family transcriptional regulator of sugar metabolism
MAFNERYNEITKILSKIKKVTVQELTERLKVSEVTIRKDLSDLEAHGKILRTHGGAVLAEDMTQHNPINIRINENIDKKTAIAKKARELVREDDTIYIDAGTTCCQFAQEIKDMNLRVVTNSMDVILELAQYPNISLFTLGGSYRIDARSFIGPIAINSIKNFQISTCFLGTSGISKEGNFSSQNTIEAELKSAILASSNRKVVLADNTKYGITAFSIFAKPKDIDILIMDSDINDLDNLKSLGIEIMVTNV